MLKNNVEEPYRNEWECIDFWEIAVIAVMSLCQRHVYSPCHIEEKIVKNKLEFLVYRIKFRLSFTSSFDSCVQLRTFASIELMC